MENPCKDLLLHNVTTHIYLFICFKETPVFVTFLSGPIQECFFLPSTVNSAESTADNGEAT